MKSMVALIRREFVEHKGAFFYAPLVLVAIFTLVLVSALVFNKVRLPYDIPVSSALRFFEIAFLGLGGLWFVYLMVALFFYYADAFNADRRNNAMLFWKSMPVSDFKVLASKMLAGLTLLPALVFVMLIVSTLILYGVTGLAAIVLPRLAVPGLLELIVSSLQIGGFALIYVALALLWYAPFYAWVGALSTLVGRWSIPLAFLIPALIGLVENLFIPDSGPQAGYFLDFLHRRGEFGPSGIEWQRTFFADDTFNAGAMLTRLLADIDWTQMAAGLIFSAIVVYLASEYRRRVVAT